jgi:hypothetical protein
MWRSVSKVLLTSHHTTLGSQVGRPSGSSYDEMDQSSGGTLRNVHTVSPRSTFVWLVVAFQYLGRCTWMALLVDEE